MLNTLYYLYNLGIPQEIDHLYYGSFPADFKFGVATASYQIEGGVEYRGQNIWDTFTREAGNIEDNSNGDIACDSFHNYEVDIDNVAALGLQFYRFSISWTRLIPTGILSEGLNENGIEYYNKVLDQLEKAFKILLYFI